MTLDIPTMYFVSVVTNVAMTAAVMYVALRQHVPGLKELAWALLANSGYYVVLGLRGNIPDLLSIGVGNMFGSLALALCLLAMVRYRDGYAPPALYAAPVVLITVVSLVFLDDRQLRLIINSLIAVFQLAVILWLLVKPGRIIVGRGRTIMVAALIMGIVVMAYRALALKTGWHEVSAFQARDSLNTLFYMAAYLVMFFLAFGFVLSTVEQASEQNRLFALEDALTQLPNRRAIFDALDQQSAQAVRAVQPFSLLILDIDHFKEINDRYGHQAGDAVLQHVAEVIRGRLRAQDIPGRIGGEEFLAVLPNTSPKGALRIAEELRLAIAGSPAMVDGREIPVTTSIGVFGANRLGAADTPDAMVSTADQALYRAKRSGRNRVEAGAPAPGEPGLGKRPEIA